MSNNSKLGGEWQAAGTITFSSCLDFQEHTLDTQVPQATYYFFFEFSKAIGSGGPPSSAPVTEPVVALTVIDSVGL